MLHLDDHGKYTRDGLIRSPIAIYSIQGSALPAVGDAPKRLAALGRRARAPLPHAPERPLTLTRRRDTRPAGRRRLERSTVGLRCWICLQDDGLPARSAQRKQPG